MSCCNDKPKECVILKHISDTGIETIVRIPGGDISYSKMYAYFTLFLRGLGYVIKDDYTFEPDTMEF